MTREEVYSECLSKLYEANFLMLELPTGFGKSKLSIDLVNNLVETKYNNNWFNSCYTYYGCRLCII